jgi:hypothetical protein
VLSILKFILEIIIEWAWFWLKVPRHLHAFIRNLPELVVSITDLNNERIKKLQNQRRLGEYTIEEWREEAKNFERLWHHSIHRWIEANREHAEIVARIEEELVEKEVFIEAQREEIASIQRNIDIYELRLEHLQDSFEVVRDQLNNNV